MGSTSTGNGASGKVLLTGATGHLGANLLRRLLDDGHEVRVLLRRASDNGSVEGLGAERAYGDLRDRAAVDAAVKGCRRVYHVAAKVSTLDGDGAHKREVYECNVVGTRHVMESCLRHGVEKAVVTSSFSAVGYDPGAPSRPSDEEMRYYPFDRALPYECSKAFAEMEVLRAVSRGLDACIATSCAVVGPHDYKPSRMGRALCDFANGKLRAYIDGGFEFVSAHDIVEGHLLAMARGRRGDKYIIATEFMTLPEIMSIWAEITGRPKPRVKLPASLMLAVAEVASPLLTRLAPDFPQRFTPGAVRILRLRRHADTSKARRELGFRPTSLRDAWQQAYDFFVRRGAIRGSGPRRAGQAGGAPITAEGPRAAAS
ncbi:MAG TPA: NAD-dependent epimerase/dehydratase family protein [Polyangiaceae bacterium]|nr:NAD-dependent epimerase/dehydratase family protein [Polyangiaceae bacterium]